ncbi:MAG: NAD(P)-dependent dehydrogenase (short-subunit alcohol dehydrogenase family) [Myxococcota bacterium]|jgi:NAD(P)-dependent dehydrogenase (short-subunit alcohol dehydrogenase family)
MQTAVITGVSRGLGRALAITLIEQGVYVVGIARPSAELDALAKQVGPRFTPIAADVADPEAMVRAAARAFAALRHVDLLVHNASTLGPLPLQPALDITAQQLSRLFAVNVTGPHALTRRIAGAMVLRGQGTVLAISSDAAVKTYEEWGPYSAAKAANDHLYRVLAAENPAVQFITVDPGEMDTAMHAAALPHADVLTLRRPDQVAQGLLTLLTHAQSGVRYVLEVTP